MAVKFLVGHGVEGGRLLPSEGWLCVRCSLLNVREGCLSGTSSCNPSVSWMGWLGDEEGGVE